MLYSRFKPHGLILSVAVGASKSTADISYNIPVISQIVDFINLMTYDFHGSFQCTSMNAPLYRSSKQENCDNINNCVRLWISAGVESEKLILGIPAYGRSFTLKSSSNNNLGAATHGPGQAGLYTQDSGSLGYNEICEIGKNWIKCWEDEQKLPYAYNGDQWVGYDDIQSVELKCQYIKRMNLGGAMVWSIDTDEFRNEQFSICKTLYEYL